MSKTHSTNYHNTFIEVAADCPAQQAEIPPSREPKSAAQIEYKMLVQSPYKYTSDDVLYAAYGKNKNISRNEFFSKEQPCMRSSPLVKRCGWGVHSNTDGKIAIVPVNSEKYNNFINDKTLKHLQGMRSKRK